MLKGTLMVVCAKDNHHFDVENLKLFLFSSMTYLGKKNLLQK